ncbi:MAG: hypothetical protein A2015_07090 [Spirochaetes bacterium GWF1_31_7]|nr:MAG: hypothetical protein A2Y29_00645 [Spirochaetes bacterium GWE2_31_10]OHD48578.1 MAG: hypothetical protein A2015_07090 [Spirochaetes bacterium GWF1_31_7]OHD76376.1 MAG: hypothetical protein A2355_14805 [Spirochaetes bacterium RIFOXYB1_FULL_32_8]HBD94709.1 hypothetical protein [Spirochaetia bacterium]HBI39037.1 hypothetical protein [Spirochaetia bacterium]
MTNDSRKKSKEELFGDALYDIEHAIGMYSTSFCTFPAEGIYDKEALAPFMSLIESCHIYLIGYTPIIKYISCKHDSLKLDIKYTISGTEHTVSYNITEGLILKHNAEQHYLENEYGERYWPKESDIQKQLCYISDSVNFTVKYIGQAFGKDGSRNAIDRLLKHETLQKIALKGVPEGYCLTLLLLSIQPNNQLITMMNPFASNKENGQERIKSGLDKLFNTTEQERIALYEASLIRYFLPEFNKEFKNSFPSTTMKILQDCYEKDFCSIVAEICHDELPFKLCSEKVEPSYYHFAKHNLHKEKDRRMFFGL